MKIWLCALVLTSSALAADWRKEVVFRANFDDATTDARVAGGDPKLYSAPSYKEQAAAKPGLEGTDVQLVREAGRTGGALHFTRKNTKAVFYKAQRNTAFDPKNWSGTVSFWLQLDPDKDLEPGYCDPLQITDKDYNNSAIWVDFTKDDKPRHFRLGVFGALTEWNPKNLNPDKNPKFNQRLAVVKNPPFARGRWTHVAITYNGLGSGAGEAKLYIDGKLQGSTPKIAEGFAWDLTKGAIRLGVNYVGLMDDLSIFRRPLTAIEIHDLMSSK